MRPFTDWLQLIRSEFSDYKLSTLRRDALAALTVAAVALPLALAFGVASGADAAAGLVTAIIGGFVIAGLAGSPFQVSGPTGAMSAVLIVLATRDGLTAVWIAAVMAGVMLIVLGVSGLGKVVSLIPSPVISGFTSGIAVVIALGQVDSALGLRTAVAENAVAKLQSYWKLDQAVDSRAAVVTGLVLIIMIVWPRLRGLQQVPGSLAGLVIASTVAVVAGWDVARIGTIPRSLVLDDRLHLADIQWTALGPLLVPAMSIAALGAIESLLCGAVAANMTGTRLRSGTELVAQGVGNLLLPFCGGVPATAAIARTSVNIKSGGVTRLAPMLHAVFLLGIALALAPVIAQIPLAALAGVLLVTCWRMNEWQSIRFYFSRRLYHAIAAYLATLAATVFLDLTQAIVIGFGISTLIFMSEISDLQIVRQSVDAERLVDGAETLKLPAAPASVYYLSGPLFFSSARRLLQRIEEEASPQSLLILSMRGVPLIDATGIEVLHELLLRQRGGGGDVLFSGLGARVENLLRRSGFMDEVGASNFFWSADRAILALHLILPPPVQGTAPAGDLDQTLLVTPHAERSQ